MGLLLGLLLGPPDFSLVVTIKKMTVRPAAYERNTSRTDPPEDSFLIVPSTVGSDGRGRLRLDG